MLVTQNSKHSAFYRLTNQIALWLEEHLIQCDQFKVNILYSGWLMTPYCISITTRYFSVINGGNNIHIKSIKSIFKVWCISAIIIVWVDHIIQWIINSVTGNLYTKAYIFILVHKDFGRAPSLVLIVVKWKYSHTIARGLLPLLSGLLYSILYELHFCGFKDEKPTSQSIQVQREIDVASDFMIYILENQ